MHAELVSLLEGADAGALERMVAGSRRHAGRRADEMADVAALPRELGVEPRVSDAERRWLEQLREQHARWLRDAVHRLADELRHHPQPTADHSHRLGRAARRVPERLGLGARSRRPSELVAIMQDVGKLAVPPELLDRPGELSAAGRAVLRGRAVAGADILARRAALELLAGRVRHVHERWDGAAIPTAWPARRSRCWPASSA